VLSGNTCSRNRKLGQTWRSVIEQYRMVTTKKCAWGTCKSDSRYPDRLKRNSNGADIFFLHFPGAKYHSAKRERWIRACHRGDGFVCTKDSYICSLHFVGQNGPTEEHPDPVSALTSTENVSTNPYLRLAHKRSIKMRTICKYLYYPLTFVVHQTISCICNTRARVMAYNSYLNSVG
jgi:hypothetical protein